MNICAFIFRFAALACITFYFWLAFLALNTFYCFGFLAHEGPCKVRTSSSSSSSSGVNFSQSSSVVRQTQALPPASPTAPFNSNNALDIQGARNPKIKTSTGHGSPLPTTAQPFLPPWPSPTMAVLTTETTTVDHQPPPMPTYVDQVRT
jgi:hypothetical protein